MTETDQSAPNEANLRRFWPENEGGRRNEAKFRTGQGGRGAPMRSPSASRRLPLPPEAGAPVAGEGEPGITNKANLRRFWPENEGRREKGSQISGPARQARRAHASAIDNKANLHAGPEECGGAIDIHAPACCTSFVERPVFKPGICDISSVL